MNWELLGSFFAALVGVLNPVGKIAIWSKLTGNLSPAVRLRLAFWNCGIAGGLLLFFLWFGKSILNLFGIQLPAFQVSGGVILFITAISIFQGRETEEMSIKGKAEPSLESAALHPLQRIFVWSASFFRRHKTATEEKERAEQSPQLKAQRELQRVVVPMAVPLLAGPGALTTVILFGVRAQDMHESLQLSGALLLSLLFVLGTLSIDPWIERYTGQTLLSILVRIFALLLAGIAAQLIFEGLALIMPGLAVEGESVSQGGGL
jgi:multiple antibiotic resistance protein